MKLSQAIRELTQIQSRVGDIEFKIIIRGEIIERDTEQCFATENFHIVAVAKDFCPPDLFVTPLHLDALGELNDQCSGRIS
jgi:hypothetical protein